MIHVFSLRKENDEDNKNQLYMGSSVAPMLQLNPQPKVRKQILRYQKILTEGANIMLSLSKDGSLVHSSTLLIIFQIMKFKIKRQSMFNSIE